MLSFSFFFDRSLFGIVFLFYYSFERFLVEQNFLLQKIVTTIGTYKRMGKRYALSIVLGGRKTSSGHSLLLHQYSTDGVLLRMHYICVYA